VNVLNVGSRQMAQNVASSALSAVSQKISKLFSSNVSSSFGKTLGELQAAQDAPGAAAASSALRQNLVATLSNSSAAATIGTPAASDPPESAATGLFEQIVASEQATAAASNPVAQGQPLTATVTPAAPPTPYVFTQTPSTDPAVFTTMSYSEELNYSSQADAANLENDRRYQNYMTEFQNWQTDGSQGQAPDAPVYETVNRNGFDQWWAEYQQNMSSGGTPPDASMFLDNAPDYGNGYYGAQGTSQVGTLYNPTGPATPAQVQAASNAGAPGGNSVATASTARATAASTPPAAAATGAATGLMEEIVASEPSTAPISNPIATSQAGAAAVTPAAPPTPYAFTQTPSTDPAVFTTMSYSEELNYSSQADAANLENDRRYQNYMTEFQNWQTDGSQGQPPQAPVYEIVDRNGFDQWWAEYQQNMSAGGTPPDNSMFLINAPDYGNGYYGAPGSSQVGTLYNPTGPATPAQIQAANNAAATNNNSSAT
jgi:hypothetical protein